MIVDLLLIFYYQKYAMLIQYLDPTQLFRNKLYNSQRIFQALQMYYCNTIISGFVVVMKPEKYLKAPIPIVMGCQV